MACAIEAPTDGMRVDNEPENPAGENSREATPEEVCRVVCPEDMHAFLDSFYMKCGHPEAGESTAREMADAYRQDECIRECIPYLEETYPAVCRDEAMLYLGCLNDPDSLECLEPGTATDTPCVPLSRALESCVAANS